MAITENEKQNVVLFALALISEGYETTPALNLSIIRVARRLRRQFHMQLPVRVCLAMFSTSHCLHTKKGHPRGCHRCRRHARATREALAPWLPAPLVLVVLRFAEAGVLLGQKNPPGVCAARGDFFVPVRKAYDEQRRRTDRRSVRSCQGRCGLRKL
jgi:hypothetical protein